MKFTVARNFFPFVSHVVILQYAASVQAHRILSFTHYRLSPGKRDRAHSFQPPMTVFLLMSDGMKSICVKPGIAHPSKKATNLYCTLFYLSGCIFNSSCKRDQSEGNLLHLKTIYLLRRSVTRLNSALYPPMVGGSMLPGKVNASLGSDEVGQV